MNRLKDKVAVVTGASKGIGAAIARRFAAAGAKVVVNYASSKEGADKVVKEITDNGGMAIGVQADVSKEADVTRLFEQTNTVFSGLDILVNNAVFQGYAPIELVSAESFHSSFNVNVLGPILTIQAALKLFGDKGGNIINISSGASKMPLPAASMRKCLLPIRRWVEGANPMILPRQPCFWLPMMRPGSRENKSQFQAVCMGFDSRKKNKHERLPDLSREILFQSPQNLSVCY